jgi:hypothetical protein
MEYALLEYWERKEKSKGDMKRRTLKIFTSQ